MRDLLCASSNSGIVGSSGGDGGEGAVGSAFGDFGGVEVFGEDG